MSLFNFLWIIWLFYTPLALKGLYAFLRNLKRYTSNVDTYIHSQSIIFQITTKGGENDIVDRGIKSIKEACSALGFTKYRIDVVTDSPSDNYQANVIHVPSDYKTKNKTLFKARALQYAVEYRRKRGENSKDIWVFHMDSESVLTTQCLKAILAYAENGKALISEGPIIYPHKFFSASPLTALAESIRPFNCYECVSQMRGYPIFLHGSNLLVRADVEDNVGWDFGGLVLAEDQRFGYEVMKLYGKVFGWHGGILEEQPPLTIRDMLRQRGRWFIGSLQNLNVLTLRRKIVAMYFLIAWALGIPSFLICLISLFIPQLIPAFLRPLLLLNLTVWLLGYQVGLYWNIKPLKLPHLKRIILHSSTLILTPILGLLESMAAILAIIKRKKVFVTISK